MRLKFIALLALAVLACAGDGYAQNAPSATGSITAADTTCSSGAVCVVFELPANTTTATIQLRGTFVGTAQFEVTANGFATSPTWVSVSATPVPSGAAVTSATGTGVWQANVAGMTHARVRASAYVSGTIGVDINASGGAPAAAGTAGSASSNLAQVGGNTVVTGGVNGSQGVGGLAADGAAQAGNPVLVAGSDGANAQALLTSAAGRLNVAPTFAVAGADNVANTIGYAFNSSDTAVPLAVAPAVFDGTNLDQLRGTTAGIYVQGPGAYAGAITGNPVLAGGSDSGGLTRLLRLLANGEAVVATTVTGADAIANTALKALHDQTGATGPLEVAPFVKNDSGAWDQLRGTTKGMAVHGPTGGFRCTVTVSTATTIQAVGGSCAAPGASTSLYVTDISFSSNAQAIAADAFPTLKYGTGGTCGSGTTVFWGAFMPAATQQTIFESFATPIKIPANNEICWINSTAGSKFIVITGFIAPG